ncbi:MAG: YncE family protein [Acidobacteria bacterium]|nr:MAG: YncE family protein [Acidobacteriota bacterium]REJ99100.1 MAG: YncE family protein [Acidobacteriota bacterium]REK16179.1 MAG: YncE family protein [Acidobacteriota bacterium]REK43860.1 MAG: YncE family protein [Acidobacteriota bacterium]
MKFQKALLPSIFFSLLAFPLLACAQGTGRTELLILNKNEAKMVIVDAATLEKVGEVPTGDFPHEVAVSADGKTAYVANYGAQQPNNSISVIDIPGRKEIKRIDLGGFYRPHGIAVVDGKVFFTSESSRTVARLDPQTEKIDWVMGTGQTATHMLAITPDGGRLYTANIASDTVTSINLKGPPSPANIKQIAVGRQPEAIDVSPNGKEVWVGQNGDGKISIIDPATDQVKESIEVGKVPIRVKFTPDGKYVLVSDASSGELVVVDAATRKEVKRASVGGVPVGILVQPDTKRAYVALTQLDTVKVFDMETMEFIKDLKPGDNPDGLGWAAY